LHILLFILYSVAGGYAIVRLPFFRNSGIRPGVLLLLFAIHVLTGCLHNMIAWRFYPGHGDIWSYYENSIATRDELFNDFHAFLRDNSTWGWFTHNSLINIHLILNFFSYQNLYINTLLFSFPVFLGTTALFRVFRRHFPGSMPAALSVYLLPSALFWTSCVHREGALYMFLGFFFYSLDRRAMRTAAIFFLLIAYFRSAVTLTLIPAVAVWWWLSIPSRSLRKKLLLAGGAGLLLFIALAGPLLLKILAHQQQAFQDLEGHSRIALPVMDGSLTTFLHTLPAALLDGWLQPLPGVGGQKIYIVFSLELLLIWAIVILALLRRRIVPSRLHPLPQASTPAPAPPPASTAVYPATPASPPAQPAAAQAPDHFAACCVLFALGGMLLVGLIVPFVGAIVRYRSIYLPFLLAPFLHGLGSTSVLRRFGQWIAHRL